MRILEHRTQNDNDGSRFFVMLACDVFAGKKLQGDKRYISNKTHTTIANSQKTSNRIVIVRLDLKRVHNWLNQHFRNQANSEPYLLVMDVATFHKTPKILGLLNQLNITAAMIPPGCTGMLQPFDTAVNAPDIGLQSARPRKC